MEFNKDKYLTEMKAMVDKAIQRMKNEKSNFEIFTASIWTDPNAAVSSVSFDSKSNSENSIKQSNEWNKKYYDQFLAEGDLEQAKLFEPITRNCNPADFELTNFLTINNASIPVDWEEETNGKCWDELEPILKQIGEYAFAKTEDLKTHPDFELSVNGRQDWYEFIWRK